MQSGQTPSDHEFAQELIADAKTCGCYAGRGALEPLDSSARELLLQIYGEAWLADNESLLRAMLTFVEEFRAATSEPLRQFYAADAPESCLLNVFNCMKLAGAFSQPTIPRGRPDTGGFILAFSGGNLLEMSNPQATSFILMHSVTFASQCEEESA